MSTPLASLRSATPPRTVTLAVGDHYYDAAASTRESDYGTFLATVAEDFYFSAHTRWIVLGRLRREIRNNPYLAGLVNKFPEAIGQSTLRSRTSSRPYNDAKDTFWFRYAKALTHSGDSLRTVEDILKRELLFAGELFLVELANGRVQLIPSEFCGSPVARAVPAGDGGREVNGLVTNAAGEITHYRFGSQGTLGAISFAAEASSLVEARHVLHVFEKDRVHMGRGLPWLLPCLRPAHDLYEITRAKTKQIKDVSSIFGTIEKLDAAKALAAWAAQPPATGENESTAEDPTAPADRDADPAKVEPIKIELRPGTFIALEPGEKLNKLTSDYQAGDYKELVMLMLHAISSPIGLPVELWFSGLGDVNYSGFKGLGTQWNARRRYIHGFLEEKFLDPLHAWRIAKAAAEGDLPANPDGDDELIDWRWRRTAILDDEKEGKANAAKLASGEISHADIWEEKGLYAEEVFAARRASWIKLLVAAGELEEGADHAKVKVPLGWLLRNELPGETTYPRLPSGGGSTERDPEDERDEDAEDLDRKADDLAAIDRHLAAVFARRAVLQAA